jgi:cytochrome P450
VSLAGPEPVGFNPLVQIARDLRAERAAGAPFPAGDTRFSLARTRRFTRDPLNMLLEAYERHGPVFTLRALHQNVVFVLGPAANHHVLVSHAQNFSWRRGHFSDLIPLLGDGMLTIDGPFHRRSRQIMLPAFHRERIAASIDLMAAETDRALAGWRDGGQLDLYHWTRGLALRIAMRALFGLDPDRARGDLDAAREFERALGYYGEDYVLQALRGPLTPWARMRRARRRLDDLIFGEIARRRHSGERGEDVLSLLLDATDEDGSRLSDRHVRDQVMTLLFAGHDTTTSTVAFLVYELARHPEAAAVLRAEHDAVLGDAAPTAEQLMGGALPELDMALDETLRLYPPAWIGPRLALEPFELEGVRVPGGVPVNYCSWASHRLPDVWDEPAAFRPRRFTAEAKARMPKGAYVPFGGGSRTCIGMRFGQLEIKVIAAALLRGWELSLVPGWTLDIRQTPTIGPRDGMPVLTARRGR